MQTSSDPLEQALLAQAAAQQTPGPRLPTSDPGDSDPVIQRALRMLPAFDKPVTFEKPKLLGNPTPRSGKETNAWIDPRRPSTVYVPGWTRVYRNAEKGDALALQQLAGILSHERFHVANGPDEDPAYEEQIRTLIALGAPQTLIDEAKTAQAFIARNRAAAAQSTAKK